MRKCSWHFQWEVEATERLHRGAAAMERACPGRPWKTQLRMGTGVSVKLSFGWLPLLPFYFFCFPSFQPGARSTSIGKINLNKSIKVTGMVEVRLQQKLHSRPAQATQGSRAGSSGTQSYTEKKGWLVGTGNKYQQALAGDLGLNYCSSCCFL